MTQKKIELLAPAGNMEALIAAVNGGADAIFLGLKNFSARAFAGNFSHEEFCEAIAYCHARDVRIYVTINTMLFETEIENAKKEVAFLYENDCDGILVQDLGLFHYIRTCYPDFDVHCSTQMHIHNMAGVKYMQKEGASRVVLARETPIEIIRDACATGMEIEVFAYGAICISYSGQCLMSQAIKNRSANRGMCAQCCRLKYYPDEEHSFKEGDYILSPKDLNTIEHIPDLIEAGVSSLKIEGRMKRPEYVWLVTNTFRQAIDAYYRGEPFHVDQKRLKDLLLMFNRGFSKGHIFHDDVTSRMSQYRPNHQGVTIGKVLQFNNGRVQVKLSDTLYQHDGLRILNEPVDTGLTAVKIYKNEKLVNHADAGDIVWLDCHSKPHPKKGQSLQKTSDTVLLQEIAAMSEDQPRITPLQMHYEARVNQPLRITVRDDRNNIVVVESEQVCQPAQKAPVTEEKLLKALSKMDNYPFTLSSIEGNLENVFLPVSIMNETRRTALQKVYEKRTVLHKRQGKQPYDFHLQPSKQPLHQLLVQRQIAYQDHCVLPVVNENLDTQPELNDVVLSSIGDLNLHTTHAIAGMTMNLANSYALAYVLSKGVDAVIFSSECSNSQIHDALEAFEKRYGFVPYTYRLVYGKRVAMYIKDGFMKDHGITSMTDYHGNHFEIHYNNNVTEIEEPDIYRSDNPYCYGSYLILGDNEKNEEEILEEANEELFERI